MIKSKKYLLFIVISILLLCIECARRFSSEFILQDNHLEQVQSFLIDNRDELNKMVNLLKNSPDISEGPNFPFETAIKPYFIEKQKFSDDFPRSYNTGFRSVAIYNSCLILSDMKRGLATEILYCEYNIMLPFGEYRNGTYIRNSLGNGWHLLTYDDYISGSEKGFCYSTGEVSCATANNRNE
jgi:hypothetical protein